MGSLLSLPLIGEKMGLKEQIATELIQALKAHEGAKVSTLRLLMAAFNNMEIEKRTAGIAQLEDKDYQAVVKREAKKRQESIEIYKTAGRTELQQKEEAELGILTKYLPAEMGEAEVRAIVDAVVAEKGTDNMGMLIGEVMKRTEGRADGGLVARLVKDKLG
ncbi:TPA: glutamyl-tRNA amidotransferase [Patescibacteria group bacterium]|nr:glutamyl-tRNA amidotransferase [Patescibacteria group bacterium]